MADEDGTGEWQYMELKRFLDWATAAQINPDAVKVLTKEGSSSMEVFPCSKKKI